MSWTITRGFVALNALACASGVTMRDNQVHFHEAESISWKETAHSITGGQPWGGASTTHNTTLNIKAGRHASTNVADDFSRGLNRTNMIGISANTILYPVKLNFALFGTFTVHLKSGAVKTCENMRIGQGHAAYLPLSPGNNWWVGGPACQQWSTDTEALQLICEACGLGLKAVGFATDNNLKAFEVEEGWLAKKEAAKPKKGKATTTAAPTKSEESLGVPTTAGPMVV